MDLQSNNDRDVFNDLREACGEIGLELTSANVSPRYMTTTAAVFTSGNSYPAYQNTAIEIALRVSGESGLCSDLSNSADATHASRISSTIYTTSHTKLTILLEGDNVADVVCTFKKNIKKYYLQLESIKFDKEVENLLATNEYNN